MKGDRYVRNDNDCILEVIGYGIYGPDQATYFKYLYPDNISDYCGHLDCVWDFKKLEIGPNIENMKLGDMYIHNDDKNIIMVEEIDKEKLLAKFKYILAEGVKHKEGDSVWFDLRIVDSRWTKLEGDEEGNKKG
jgi:hypothetical protein